MKTCTKCNQRKPYSAFQKRTNENGTCRYVLHCRSCVNKAAKEKRERLKNEYIAEDEKTERNDGFVFVFSPKPTQTQKRKKESWNNILRLLR